MNDILCRIIHGYDENDTMDKFTTRINFIMSKQGWGGGRGRGSVYYEHVTFVFYYGIENERFLS